MVEQMEAQQEQAESAEGAEVSEAAEQVSEQAANVSEQAQTFNQEYIDSLIAEKEKEWQVRKDTEFSELQNKVGEYAKQAKLAALAAQEQREIEAWGDTPEVKAFQEERRSLAEEKAKTEALANQVNMTNRMVRAKEIVSSHPGMDAEDLMRCKTPEEMQDLVNIYEKVKANLQGEKPPQKVDSGVPSAPGVNLKEMDALSAIKFGIEHPSKE